MARLVGWSIRRRWLVLGLWVAALAVLTGALGGVRPDFKDEFSLPGTDSQAATDLVAAQFSKAKGDTDRVVWRVRSGTVDDAAVRARMRLVLDGIADLPDVHAVTSPYGSAASPLISADRRSAYAPLQYSVPALQVPKATLMAIVTRVRGASTEELVTAVGGPVVGNLDTPTLGPRELIGVLFAAVVLFLSFGSVLASLVPVVIALVSLGIGASLLGLLSRAVTIGSTAPTIAALIGIGVGIDYALFIVARHRANLLAGVPLEDSLLRAMNTSGRAVVFAGVTVCISLLGMLTMGITALNGAAIGASVAVAVTVMASVTLLPASLSLLGLRILSRRRRATVLAAEQDPHDRLDVPAPEVAAGRLPRAVAARPVLAALIGVATLALLAGPLTSIRLGIADQGSNASTSTTRQAYDLLSQGFGAGFNGPLLIAVRLPHARTEGLRRLTERLSALPDVEAVTPPAIAPDGRTAIVQVVPKTSPQDARTSALIRAIRAGTSSSAAGLTVHVGGTTAVFDDFASVVGSRLWVFLLFVIGLSLLLLVVVFRSLAIPLLGAALNLLSASAAFGVIVAVFQWGWGEQLIGVTRAGPIDPSLPVIAFAILFGLSMDYQVFLITRIHEAWSRSGRAREAVLIGQSATAPVITAAAVIMVFVFSSFVLADNRTVKLIGLSMAIAVLLDAFIVRQLVVPAVLHLLAGRAWWLPRRVGAHLPRLQLEHPAIGIHERGEQEAGAST